ncbi:MAG: hypothetical protein GF399_03205 [Candidatus Coatesbacteria bacterium]|nr:hypothetical protein [Candidatus Coatesbacteria bacterium]
MGWLEDKLGKWRLGIAAETSERDAAYIVAGADDLAGMTPVERSAWTAGALERFKERVPASATRRRLLTSFSCSYLEEVELGLGPEPLERMRSLYRKTGDLDGVLAAMREANAVEGRKLYPAFERRGATVAVTKPPRDPAAYEQAATPLEKRRAACFCPLAAAGAETLPEEYCYCGAGWSKIIWEFILERSVEVEVSGSLMAGDEACSFIIRPSAPPEG